MGSTSSNRAPSRSGSVSRIYIQTVYRVESPSQRADPMEISDSEDGDMSEGMRHNILSNVIYLMSAFATVEGRMSFDRVNCSCGTDSHSPSD